MKLTNAVSGLVTGTLLLLASGCGKPDEVKTTTTPETSVKAANSTGAEVRPAADNSAITATPSAPTPTPTTPAPTPASVAATPTNAPAPAVNSAAAALADSQVQTVLDKAKSLIADQKFQDALVSLQQLTGIKLTADQQKLVDDFKVQIQTALAKKSPADAAGALGGALGIKK